MQLNDILIRIVPLSFAVNDALIKLFNLMIISFTLQLSLLK